MSSEFDRIEQLRHIFHTTLSAVPVGIGDDAAVLDILSLGQNASRVVWTVDSSVEGIHFRRDLAGFYEVGWRSFMAAASNLAAMAARPIGVLSAVMLTPDMSDTDLYGLARGRAAADAIGTAVLGGNLSKAGECSVSTTVLGHATRTVCRNGAMPGHVLAVSGELGYAGAGLQCLLQKVDPAERNAERAIRAWKLPVARIESGLLAGVRATAMIDVSDGLAQDASHIADASGVRIELDAKALQDQQLEPLAQALGTTALELVLAGGEDYALLATFASEELPEGFRRVGRCEEGRGVYVGDRRVDKLGHDHFRER